MQCRSLASLLALAVLSIARAADAAPSVLTPDTVDGNLYGFNVGETVEARERADFTFRGESGADLSLSLIAEDIDSESEVSVWLNERLYGHLATTVNNGRRSIRIGLPGNSHRYGVNALSFRQRRPGNKWGVERLKLSVVGPRVVTLTPDVTDSGLYGFAYLGRNEERESARFSFVRTDENLHLFYTAYDIDNPTEVAILLNGREVGHLETTDDNGTAEGMLALPLADQKQGRNTLEFHQSRPGNRWGVTSLLLSLESSCAYL